MGNELVSIPKTLTAGDLWSWVDDLPDYPAPIWTLTYYFVGPQSFSAAATANGTTHAIEISAAATGALDRGTYAWQAQAANGLDKKTVARGRLEVEPNLSDATKDHRSFEQHCLDDLNAAIANRMINPDVLSYSIAGRTQSFRNWDEILALRDKFRYAVAAELGLRPGHVFVRLTRE